MAVSRVNKASFGGFRPEPDVTDVFPYVHIRRSGVQSPAVTHHVVEEHIVDSIARSPPG